MSLEIERKFLVADHSILAGRQGERLVQAYIAATGRATVRVRIAGQQAWLTLKGATKGITRRELEYPIPVADAELCLAELCAEGVVSKTRYRIPHAGHVWEVDVFDGANAGLVLAEIELSAAEEGFERPPWLGEEVSGDPRYFNSQLAERPFGSW
jgi:CYTH domain-containing protein